MGYDANGNYTGIDTEFDPGAGAAGPLGTTAYRDTKNVPNVAADAILDIPASAVRAAKMGNDAWVALQQYLAQRVPVISDPKKRQSYGQIFADQSEYGDAAHAVREDAARAADTFAKEHPNATPQDALEVGKERLKENESWVNKGIRRYVEATDDITGAPREEDRTGLENIVGAIVPALIPGGEVAALNNAGKVGRGVNRVLEKTKIPGLDLIDPRTQNFTAGGVALNGGIGGLAAGGLEVLQAPVTPPPQPREHIALEDPDKGVTTYTNDPVSNGEPTTIVDAGPHDDGPSAPEKTTSIGLANYSMAALPFIAALGMRFHPHVGTPKFNPMSTHGGPGHVEAPKMGPNAAAYALDEQAPLESAIATAHGNNTALGRELGTDSTVHVRTNVAPKVEQAINTGQLDNVQRTIPSISGISKQILETEKALGPAGPQFVADLNRGMAFRSEYADRMFNIKQLDDSVKNADQLIRAKQQLALQTTNAAKSKSMFEEIYKLQKKRGEDSNELSKLLGDAPETRLGLVDQSNNDLATVVRGFESDPRMAPFIAHNEEINKGILGYLKNNKVLSDVDHASLMANKSATHVYMKNDPYIGSDGRPLTGISRMYAQFKAGFKAMNDDFDTMNKEARAPSSKAVMSRDPAEKLSDRVNNPINWLDAKHAEIERAVRYVSRQNFVRDTVENIKLGPNHASVMTPKLAPGGKPLWSGKALDYAINELKMIDPARDTIVNHGGKFEVFRFNDPRVHTTLSQPPMMRLPVLSQLKTIFTANTTGWLRPAFAPVRVAYDAAAFSANRAAHEPHGIAGGYEQLRRAASAGGVSLPESPQWMNNTARFAGPFGIVADNSAIHAVSAIGAIENFLRSSQVQIAHALANDLAARSPLFEMIGRINPQYMKNLADSMLKNYADSLHATAMDLRIINPRELNSWRTSKRDYERMTGRAIKKFANNPIGMAFVEASNVYQTGMRAYEQGVMYSAFTSMANRELAKRGLQHFNQLPPETQKAIARYARTAGGDFARVPGHSGYGRTVQGLNAAIPYNNVMLRSIQSIWRAAADHPGTFGAAVMSGIVAPRIMNEWILSNWDDDAHSFWFEKTPHWDRVQNMPSLTWAGLSAYYHGEPFKPEYVEKNPLLPEMRTPGIVVSEALRAMGMYGKRSFGSAVNDPSLISVLDVAAEGLKQGFAPLMPSAVNIATGANGVKVDAGNLFNNIPALADAMANGSDAARARPGSLDPTQAVQMNRQGSMQNYNPTSEVNKNTVMMVQALLGGAASTALEVFDTYSQKRGKGDGIADAAVAALSAGYENEKAYAKKQITRVTGNLLFQKNDKVYTGTPAQEYVRDARSTYSLVSGKNAVITKKTPIDNGGLLDNLVQTLRFDGVHDPELKEMTKEFFELNTQSKSIAANRQLKPDERAVLDKEVALKLQEVTDKQAKKLQELEQSYIEYYGDEFKAKYGKTLSFAQMRAVITKAGNAARYQPSDD